ncbi:MAG: O-antigen ligase family protein [Gammaproteobacteria bacterium]
MSSPAHNTRSPTSSGVRTIEKRVRQYTLAAYLVFVAGYFLTTNAVDQYKFLVGFVFVPGLLLLPRLYRVLSDDVVLQLAGVYLLYLLFTGLWAPSPDYAALATSALQAGLILFFMALTAFLSGCEPKWFDVVLACAILIAAGNALLSILLWEDLGNFTVSRLVGLGTLREPNSAGAVYGLYGLLAIGWLGRTKSRPLKAALYLSGFVLLAFLLLTQSRGAIIAAVVGLALLLVLNLRDRPLIHLLALLASVAVSLLLSPELDDRSLLRSLTWDIRLDFWADSIPHIADAPLFGSGYLSGLTVHSDISGEEYTNWHNSYLAALRDGGLIGLTLLLGFLAVALHRAWRIGRATGDYALLALLCFGLIYMLSNTDALITRPRELWPVLWFPLGLLAARPQPAARRERVGSREIAATESR